MFTIDPKEMKTSVFHSYMLASIAPRPIAFASTVDKEGNMNLAPFSFFNAFGSKPPTIVFLRQEGFVIIRSNTRWKIFMTQKK